MSVERTSVVELRDAVVLLGSFPALAEANLTVQRGEILLVKGANGAETATVAGDPNKPGIYVQLIKWPPGVGSRPHFHNQDRNITVISGTWYKGTGTKYDPDSMVAMPAGTFIVDHANGLHYDGAKGEMAVIQIVGMGPVSTTQAEEK